MGFRMFIVFFKKEKALEYSLFILCVKNKVLALVAFFLIIFKVAD